MDAWFDVVDAEDRVVRQEKRSVVHREGLLHRAIHLLVRRPDGAIFLQRRSMKKDSAPGKWAASVSGHVDAGEDYLQAALRESWEEIGLDLAVEPEELARIDACSQTGMEFVRVYLARGDEPFRLDPEEVAEGRWCSVAEVDRWMQARPGDFATSFRLVWERVRLDARLSH